jgi:hypothetical protein
MSVEQVDTMFDLVLGGILASLTIGTMLLAWWVRTTEV